MVCARQRQQVVVRAGEGYPTRATMQSDVRPRMSTLIGLGSRGTCPTLPDDGHAPRELRRPVVLLDDVDAALAAQYRAEAERILATGFGFAEAG